MPSDDSQKEAAVSPLLPETAVLRFLEEPLVVGLSGGRDSVVLLHLLRERDCRMVACHVHHGIRGAAADADADFCRRLCAAWDIPFALHHIDVPALAAQQHQSLETAARCARRAALEATAKARGCRVIALAQHADDQAETILFRLARGSSGLRGIRPVHESGDFLYIRPLLEQPRAAITAYAEACGLSWVEDATNAVPDVARNRLRLEVLPALNRAMGREVAPILNRSAALQAETLEALEAALARLPLTDPQGRLYLPFLEDAPLALRKAVLHRYLQQCGVPDICEAMVLAVEALLQPTAPVSKLALPGGFFAQRRQKRLLILRP